MARQKRIAIGVLVFAGALVLLALLVTWYRWYSKPILVPNVMRLTVGQATSTLENLGLDLGEVRYVATDRIAEQRVVEQSPSFSTSVRRGDEVDVTVAVAPEPADVPDVIGLDAEEASRLLSEALYEVSSIEVFDETKEGGLVLDQLPEGGTEWTTGRRVGIAISAGRDDGTGIAVPNLIGADQVRAELALKDVGLEPLSFIVTTRGTEGRRVVLQLPDAGTNVPPRTTVLLLFTFK
jgi:serine/threonine-protein kinase